MVTISLCMIVKNEEEVLGRCLNSVKDVADEIIIVDTGSSDATKSIAEKFTDKIFDFEWIYDFSAARNFAYSKASMDYQMWLDADDILPEAEKQKLLELKKTLDPSVDMVSMKYHTSFDADGNPILTSTRERLTKRINGYKWQDPVHECIPLAGNIHYSDITIWHLKPPVHEVSTRNLDIYEKAEKSGSSFTPRQMYYFARELKDHGNWAKSVYYFSRFLEEGKGWREDNIGSCYCLGVCYKLLGEPEKAINSLIRSFAYDSPRAEICCEIGYIHKQKEDYETALKWFEVAANLKAPNSLGFILCDYWGYIPYLECCVCLCRLGRYKEAYKKNERAGKIKPKSHAVQHNREYIKKILNAKA